jgi:hypothetical protein
MNSRQLKQALHEELQAAYPAFFESKLAVTLLRSKENFPVVKKISEKMGTLLRENQDKLSIVETHPKIKEELYERRYFGHLAKKDQSILADMMAILTDDKATFDQVLQVHCIFTYRVYPLLNQLFLKKLKALNLHSKDSPRIDRRKTALVASFPLPDTISDLILEYENYYEPTQQLGILKTKGKDVFSKLIGKGEKTHARAIDRFEPNHHSFFFKTISPRKLPFVAGPSGHTISLMLGSLFYGLETLGELQEYALACFVFLASGGNHSFHEVMMAAKWVAEVPHEFESYDKSLPEAFKNTSTYRKLAREFPEYLEEVSGPSLKLL